MAPLVDIVTTLYLDTAVAGQLNTHRATNSTRLDGTATGWEVERLTTTAPADPGVGRSRNTVAGTTVGIELGTSLGGSPALEWVSDPVASEVTISGAVTANLYAGESNMAANVAINFVLDKISGADLSITNIVTSARTTELGTSIALATFSATPGTGVTVNVGDRLRVRIFGDDAGTMASGHTFTLQYADTTFPSRIDTTETVSFQSHPSNTTNLYLRTTAASGGINPGSATELEMWTSAGSSVTSYQVDVPAGFHAGTQWTDSLGGTAVEWYTRSLAAVTITGAIYFVGWFKLAVAGAAGVRLELATTASDGTSASTQRTCCLWDSAIADTAGRIPSTTSSLMNGYLAGQDIAITAGQRLRLRVFGDDTSTTAGATGANPSIAFNGGTASADGDTLLSMGVTLTEASTAGAYPFRRPFPRNLLVR